MSSKKNENRSSAIDISRINRVSENIASLLSELLKTSGELEKKSKKTRLRIFADLKPLVEALPPEERGCLVTMVAVRVEQIFKKGGSPKVKLTGGCVGRGGLGVRAEEGGSFAGVCVAGSADEGVTGGGVEAGFSY